MTFSEQCNIRYWYQALSKVTMFPAEYLLEYYVQESEVSSYHLAHRLGTTIYINLIAPGFPVNHQSHREKTALLN